MIWRIALVVSLSLAVSAQAATKKVVKHGRSSSVKKSKKAIRKSYSRDKIREESMSNWPRIAEFDSRPGKVGVPELDRLLDEHPPLGASVSEDPTSDVAIPSDQRMSVDRRDRGISKLALVESDPDPLERIKLVSEPLLGTPYRSGGESTRGFDCSGFVLTVLRAFGQDLTGRSSTAFHTQGRPVEPERLQTGDLLFFSDHHRSIGHVAIYLSEGKFVHASVQKGVIVSSLDEKYYKLKFKSARRLDGFARALLSGDVPAVSPLP